MVRTFVALYSIATLVLVMWGVFAGNDGLMLKGLVAAFLMSWMIPAMKLAFGPDCLKKKGS